MRIFTHCFCLLALLATVQLHADWQTYTTELTSELTGGHYQLDLVYDSQIKEASSSLHFVIGDAGQTKEILENWNQLAPSPSVSLAVLTLDSEGTQPVQDLTADALKRIPGSGGAEKFYQFLVMQVLPQVNELTEQTYAHKTLHTEGYVTSFGFFALFRAHPDFDTFLIESPDMEWHEAYVFRGEYNFYKTLATKLPAEAIFLPITPKTSQQSIKMIAMLKELLGYRQYQEMTCTYLEPVESSNTIDRISELKTVIK